MSDSKDAPAIPNTQLADLLEPFIAKINETNTPNSVIATSCCLLLGAVAAHLPDEAFPAFLRRIVEAVVDGRKGAHAGTNPVQIHVVNDERVM